MSAKSDLQPRFQKTVHFKNIFEIIVLLFISQQFAIGSFKIHKNFSVNDLY